MAAVLAGHEVLLHATAVAQAGQCVLLCGPPGAGKSDLALRLIRQAPRSTQEQHFELVADDQVVLARAQDALLARPPETIAGRLEVRGLGIIALPFVAQARVALHIDLVGRDVIERMPEPAAVTHLGIAIPLLRLDPFEASAPIKVGLALAQALRCDTWP